MVADEAGVPQWKTARTGLEGHNFKRYVRAGVERFPVGRMPETGNTGGRTGGILGMLGPCC